MYQAPRGTFDILPPEQPYWRYVEQKAAGLAHLYGYQRLDSPVFEDAGLFVRTVGAGTDIVEKEMYVFADRGGNQLTLRPEGTAPVCRAYLEHGMASLPQPVKLYYFATIYRYERPQAGRYREHHQFGCEAIGDSDPALDAEVISLGWHLFGSLGLGQLSLQLNSIGCKKCRPGFIQVLTDYYTQHQELCADCKVRLEKNPLRLLDCKQPTCQAVADSAPRSAEYLCDECARHFEKVKHSLTLLGLPFNLNHRLVRGLDYYTKTVFEFQPEEGGGQSTIGGGGRYDDLMEELGGKPTPAIGFATGLERIILNLKKQNVPVPPIPRPPVFVASVGEVARDEAIKLAAALRKAGLGVNMAAGGKSLKGQLRQADALGARYAVIIGEEEIKQQAVVLKDMTGGEQSTVPLASLSSVLKEKIATT